MADMDGTAELDLAQGQCEAGSRAKSSRSRTLSSNMIASPRYEAANKLAVDNQAKHWGNEIIGYTTETLSEFFE
jgi:hypothetical protein